MVLMIVLFSCVPCFSNDFEDMQKKAKQGDASAQFSLGLDYLMKKNTAEGNKWIRLAAENGNTSAQLFYGKRLPDKTKGLHWIKTAATNDNIDAQVYLGELYRTDNHYVSKNIEQAIHWLTTAANHNGIGDILKYDKAIFRLAMMYEDGDGVKKKFC
jgi:TPR repeat protein